MPFDCTSFHWHPKNYGYSTHIISNELVMKGQPGTLINKNPKDVNKDRALNAIKQNLGKYYSRKITIKECLLQSGPLTADLIFQYSAEENYPKKAYDTILVIATNYFAMLHMDMYTGFYAVNKAHTYNQVSKLVEEALEEMNNNGRFQAYKYNSLLRESRDFTKQMVEVYYRMGTDGCQEFVVSTIYAVLSSLDIKGAVGKDQIENTVRTIEAEKIFHGNHHYGYSR